MKLRVTLIFVAFLMLGLSACGSDQSGAAGAIEDYIQALASQDADLIANLACAEWEEQAQIEVDSFTAVNAEIPELVCLETGADGSDMLVTCTGKILLDYNGEKQELDVSARTYRARQEGGEWRMCGYQ